MLALSRHIQSWLFIICMLFQGVAFPLLNDQFITLMAFVVETEHENENSIKETKAEIDKIFSKERTMLLRGESLTKQAFCGDQTASLSQIFLPVVTPPPEIMA